jgi:hypothetical protein
MGTKKIEIVYGEEKIFCTWPIRAAKAEHKSLLPRHGMPNKPIKAGPLSSVLFEPPFTSISTVQSVVAGKYWAYIVHS